jgi:hypothetical protein
MSRTNRRIKDCAISCPSERLGLDALAWACSTVGHGGVGVHDNLLACQFHARSFRGFQSAVSLPVTLLAKWRGGPMFTKFLSTG